MRSDTLPQQRQLNFHGYMYPVEAWNPPSNGNMNEVVVGWILDDLYMHPVFFYRGKVRDEVDDVVLLMPGKLPCPYVYFIVPPQPLVRVYMHKVLVRRPGVCLNVYSVFLANLLLNLYVNSVTMGILLVDVNVNAVCLPHPSFRFYVGLILLGNTCISYNVNLVLLRNNSLRLYMYLILTVGLL